MRPNTVSPDWIQAWIDSDSDVTLPQWLGLTRERYIEECKEYCDHIPNRKPRLELSPGIH